MDIEKVVKYLELKEEKAFYATEDATLSDWQRNYEEGYLDAVKDCLKLLRDNGGYLE